MRKGKVRIWVAPEFARKLKVEAVTNNMMIIPYTRKLAEDDFIIERKKKKNGFDFSF